jgi:hypothetical protein
MAYSRDATMNVKLQILVAWEAIIFLRNPVSTYVRNNALPVDLQILAALEANFA